MCALNVCKPIRPSVPAAVLLEFDWTSDSDLQEVQQQKRRALLQRSSRRVEELKAKAALAKTQVEFQAPFKPRERSAAVASPADTCKGGTKSQPPPQASKSKEGKAERTGGQTTVRPSCITVKQPPAPGIQVTSVTTLRHSGLTGHLTQFAFTLFQRVFPGRKTLK